MNKIIDCDVHPTVPGVVDLLPYFDDYWQDQITARGWNSIDLSTYKPTLPLTARDDWRGPTGRAALNHTDLANQLLAPFKIDIAICNVVHGGSTHFNSYYGAAVCKATNDWLAKEWLDKDSRLRGSILLAIQDVSLAVQEIERLASDKRFVQVLMPVSGDMPFGRKYYWPIYEAAMKHGLPVAIHPGGGARYPQSYGGYHSLHAEEYFLQVNNCQYQILSLIHEGVFQEFSELKVVFLESGVSWLPVFLVDTDNKWFSARREMPWVDEAPSDLVRKHMCFSSQPFDGSPTDPECFAKIVKMIGSDDLLIFSTDYPHWQFDGDDPFPANVSASMKEKMTWTNPMKLYPRMRGPQS